MMEFPPQEGHPCEPPEAAELRRRIAKIPPRVVFPTIEPPATAEPPLISERPEDGGPFLIEI